MSVGDSVGVAEDVAEAVAVVVTDCVPERVGVVVHVYVTLNVPVWDSEKLGVADRVRLVVAVGGGV